MIRSIAATLAVALVLAACGGGGEAAAAASPAPTTDVELPKSYKFVPAAIVVSVGSTVTWSNHDDFTHNVQLPDATAPLTMAPGSSVTHTFGEPGDFAYVCSLHPRDMQGRVVVTPG